MGQGGPPMPPDGGPYGGQPQQTGGAYGGQPGAGVMPPGGYQQPQYGGGAPGPGGPGGPAEFAQTVQRAVRTPETKPFFLTSEFAVWLFTIIALLIAGAVTKAGNDGTDVLGATTVWTLVTVIGFAYIISRGVSKAGQKYRDRGGQNGSSAGNW